MMFAQTPCLAQETDSEVANVVEKPAEEKRAPIYDEKAEGSELVDAAVRRAADANKRVLIQWGANWCGWCYLLHDCMQQDRELRKTLQYEYEVVLIDIGSMDRNLDLMEKYQVDLRKSGVPYLTILDAEGEVLANQETESFETKIDETNGHDAEKLNEFLNSHKCAPVLASSLLESANQQAAAENKRVFVHFSAPWCGWCRHLEHWMHGEIHSLLEQHFTIIKINIDRMTEGREIYQEYCQEPGGIPWIAILDPKTGQAVATSDTKNGNIGHPSTDEEIASFILMLQTGTSMDAEALETIQQSLVENRIQRESIASKK